MKKELTMVLAAFIIGLILGISIMNTFISREFELLAAKNKTLDKQVTELSTDLEEMAARLERTQNNKIINDIKVELELADENSLSTFEEMSVKLDGENKISNLLMAFKGQEINGINFNLIPKIIEGREFISEGRRYMLNVDVVLITDELCVYATAILVKPN